MLYLISTKDVLKTITIVINLKQTKGYRHTENIKLEVIKNHVGLLCKELQTNCCCFFIEYMEFIVLNRCKINKIKKFIVPSFDHKGALFLMKKKLKFEGIYYHIRLKGREPCPRNKFVAPWKYNKM